MTEEMENAIIEQEVDNVEDDIKAALESVSKDEPKKEEEIVVEESKEPEKEEKPAQAEPEVKAPDTWSAAAKEEWKHATPILRAEILKRENDWQQALTRHDGDLRVGREFKDIVSPYMATIQSEGLTPTQAVAGILKNDHFLRTASPAQKTAKFYEMAAYYGIDVSEGAPQTEYVDPTIAELKQQIEELRKQADPEAIRKHLQQQQEDAMFASELAAFASDPANVHFDKVRPVVASLIGSGQAKTLKEAYEAACYASPEIRSTLIQKQLADEEAKRKAEMDAKRKASVSISGSKGSLATSTAKTSNSIEDDIREAMRSSNLSI